VQVYFYVPPSCDIAAVKQDAFLDMGTTLKSWRHKLKLQLDIHSDDTPNTVQARVVEAMLSKYNLVDLEVLLGKWCDKKN
jgi:hypothetical protein